MIASEHEEKDANLKSGADAAQLGGCLTAAAAAACGEISEQESGDAVQTHLVEHAAASTADGG